MYQRNRNDAFDMLLLLHFNNDQCVDSMFEAYLDKKKWICAHGLCHWQIGWIHLKWREIGVQEKGNDSFTYKDDLCTRHHDACTLCDFKVKNENKQQMRLTQSKIHLKVFTRTHTKRAHITKIYQKVSVHLSSYNTQSICLQVVYSFFFI